ncbi:MAG TPA: aspartyl protease family protein [Candidatus Krumholzibacteria bacterium]|nr:aspartyl protease family protein [Candidatus Krumholzibacteria bacterium]
MTTRAQQRRWIAHTVALLAVHFSFMELNAMAAPSASGAVKASIPIEFSRNQVRVAVSINGSTPFRLILDTGMPTRGVMLRHSERIDSLSLDFAQTAHVGGAGSGGGFATRVAPDERIELGGLELSGVPVIVLPPESKLLQETDGVIGAELFERFVVRIDVDRKQMDLIDPAAFEPAPGITAVPLRIRDGMPFLDARVTVQDKPVNADLAVDLGAGHGLWLNHGKGDRLAPPAGAIETTLGRGLSGDIHGHIGRVRRLELGDFTFDGVIALFPVSEHRNPGGVDFRDGFIGAEVLTRFVFTFDYRGKRLMLERGGLFAEPFEHDMSGMVLEIHGGEKRRVNSVLAGSPAAEAGVESGDVLVAIDGIPLAALGYQGISESLTRDGAVIRVTLERGGESIEKALKLRRLV